MNCVYGSGVTEVVLNTTPWEHKSANYSENDLQAVRDDGLRRKKEIELKIEEDKKSELKMPVPYGIKYHLLPHILIMRFI